MPGLGLYECIVTFKKGCLHVLDKVKLMKSTHTDQVQTYTLCNSSKN